jgi:hypothetical protein
MKPADPTRGEIHLAELITALATLHPGDAAQAQMIAGCLGFGLAAPDLAPATRRSERVYDPGRWSPPKQDSSRAARSPSGFASPPAGQTRIGLPPQQLAGRLQALPSGPASAGAAAPSWLSGGYQRLERTPGRSPPRQALFPGRTARGVLSAALLTARPGSALDVDALIGCVVEGRIPRQAPRLPTPTLARGCQVLLDFSDSMLPWWEDLRQLSGQLAALLGDERVAVFDFDRPAAPATASQWPAGKARPTRWRPEAGRPIVVASGFGIVGRHAGQRAGSGWQQFVARCAEHGCPLRILVPWSPAYWPTDLGPPAELVHWHPQTSAAMLSRRLDNDRRVR